MPRYIDADALIERLKFKRDETDINGKKHSGLECAIAQVQKQPTADVVEVVRCKDCVWWEARAYGSTIGRCENPNNGLVSEYSEETDFCSYGERKE